MPKITGSFGEKKDPWYTATIGQFKAVAQVLVLLYNQVQERAFISMHLPRAQS